MYKNKVVFLRRSKAGDHLFVHDSRGDLVKGATLIMNVAEVKELVGDKREWIKVSILPREEETYAEIAASARA